MRRNLPDTFSGPTPGLAPPPAESNFLSVLQRVSTEAQREAGYLLQAQQADVSKMRIDNRRSDHVWASRAGNGRESGAWREGSVARLARSSARTGTNHGEEDRSRLTDAISSYNIAT